jgi:hypothetical protein
MSFQSRPRTLRSLLTRRGAEGRRRRTPQRYPAARFQPRLEALEDRLTPTNYYVTATPGDPVGNGYLLMTIVDEANANPGMGDTIFLTAGVYDVETGAAQNDGTIVITDNLTFVGNYQGTGSTVTVITGGFIGGAAGAFHVEGSNIHISQMTFQGNETALANGGGSVYLSNCDLNDNGQALLNSGGTATLFNCNLSGNVGGGAISFSDGTLSCTSCTLDGNQTTGQGGGISAANCSVSLTNCNLSNDRAYGGASAAAGQGGGIYATNSTLTLTDCQLTKDTAVGGSGGGLGQGGGIYLANNSTATITNSALQYGVQNCTAVGGSFGGVGQGGGIYVVGSTVQDYIDGSLSGNTADEGGGVYVNSGKVTVSGSTLSNNHARGSASNDPGNGDGGGIYNLNGTLTLQDDSNRNQTVLSGNTADGSGGAILNSSGSVTVSNGALSGNSALGTASNNPASGDGGGVCNLNGTVVLQDDAYGNHSALTGNTAVNGGAVAVLGGSVNMPNCNLSGNTGYVDGGGMFIDPSVVTLVSCTFSGNTAPVGADLYNLDSSVTLVHTNLNGVVNNGGTITLLGSSISGFSGSGGTVTDPIANLIAQVAGLNLTQGEKNSLTSKLQAAEQSLENGNTTAALNQLNAFINQVNALVNSNRLDQLTATDLDSAVDDLIQLLG